MTIVTVWGVNSGCAINPRILRMFRSLEKALKLAFSSIPELGLTEDQVTCFFPQAYSGSADIVAFVDGLFEKDERTSDVRKRLTDAIVACIKEECPDAQRPERLVACIVRPFYEGCGFTSFKA